MIHTSANSEYTKEIVEMIKQASKEIVRKGMKDDFKSENFSRFSGVGKEMFDISVYFSFSSSDQDEIFGAWGELSTEAADFKTDESNVAWLIATCLLEENKNHSDNDKTFCETGEFGTKSIWVD